MSYDKPISVSSVCTQSRIKEFLVMKKTLELFHNCEWVLAVDDYCKEYFSAVENVETIKLLDFDGCHFGDSESQDKFKILMKIKMDSMKRGIEKNGYSLFLDSDLIFLSALDKSFFDFLEDKKKTLFLTSHCHNNSPESESNRLKYGTYNVGMLCSKDINFPDLWREETELLNCPLGLEQKPVTTIAESNMEVVEVAPITYNLGWWRLTLSDPMNLTMNDGHLCLDNERVINLHVHSDPDIGRPIEKQFLNSLLPHIEQSVAYEQVNNILRETYK